MWVLRFAEYIDKTPFKIPNLLTKALLVTKFIDEGPVSGGLVTKYIDEGPFNYQVYS